MNIQIPQHIQPILHLVNNQLIAIASRLTESMTMVAIPLDSTQCSNTLDFSRTATGFAIAKNIIASVAHIGLEQQQVCLIDIYGDRFSGKVLDIDKYWDIVFIESEKNFVPAKIAIEKPPIGSLVIASGMPYGLLRPFFSLGIISGYNINTNIDDIQVEGLIAISTPVAFGMSGGPIANIDGDVVGIIIASAMNNNGFALAIPSKRLYYSYNILNKLGNITHLRLGIRVVEGIVKSFRNNRGLMISAIYNPRLMEVCRLRIGDVILSIDDKEIYVIEDLWDALDKAILQAKNSLRIKLLDNVSGKVKECEYLINIS